MQQEVHDSIEDVATKNETEESKEENTGLRSKIEILGEKQELVEWIRIPLRWFIKVKAARNGSSVSRRTNKD